ncbi:MAG: exodeoxyribonuclease VII large subunit [Syntrophales bacterium]
MKQILTVSELTKNIQYLLESTFGLLWVEGEISNLRRPGSGHVYFTLKDEKSQIRAVVFRQSLRGMGFDLEDGMHIICRAVLNVYEQRGEYQLVIDTAEPKGIGALQVAFEQLKARLQEEGLFDPARKRPIPYLPERIGVVTSASGAVIRDILHITRRRFPSVDLLIAPVRVQGAEAPSEIVQAIADMNKIDRISVIILARGGGSLEDLAPFNDERVARAIYGSRIPVISAVGHEVDFTIADFVADLRAPTPSAAAELAVPSRRELIRNLGALWLALRNRMRRLIGSRNEDFSVLRGRLRDPRRRIADLRIHLDARSGELYPAMRNRLELCAKDYLNRRDHLGYMNPAKRIGKDILLVGNLERNLGTALRRCVNISRQKLEAAVTVLDTLSPLSVLRRGYSIAMLLPGRAVLKSSESVSSGDEVHVRLSEGAFNARVTKIYRE